MEVLFASLQHHCFWCFFWSRGPKLCPNRTGNTKFYKNLTHVHAFPMVPCMPRDIKKQRWFYWKHFLSALFLISWSKIRRFSEFSNHLHIPYMVAKISKLKVATQYLALKVLNRESYFLRKWNFFLKKPKKNAKKINNVFFSFATPHYHLTLRYVRKKIPKNFPNQFYTSFPKSEPIFQFCLGQRWQKRWQWRWRHRWKFCPET